MSALSRLQRLSRPSGSFTRSFNQSAVSERHAKKLEGRVAVATGCTGGIGYEMAKRLAEDGAHVVLSSRKQENVDCAISKFKAEGLSNVSGYACHIADEEQRNELIKNTARDHGGFDIVLNNAGVNAHKGSFLTTSDSAFDKAFDVNVKANFCLVRDSVPYMKNRKHQCAILLTSSISGFRSAAFPSAYAVSKGAIMPMVQALAAELYQHNIRINCLTLGLFDTPFAEVMIGSEEARKYYTSYGIMKRVAHPSECAPIASFLCSDDSSYVTGENVCLTGGVYSRL